MTKKFWFIGGGVLLLGIIGFIIYSMMTPKDLARHIPNDAVMAVRVDMASMAQKMPLDQMKDLSFFQFIKKDMPAKAREQFEKIMKDPKASGINFLQSPYFFLTPGSIDFEDMTMGVVVGISDKASFLETFKAMTKGELSSKEEGGFTVFSDDDMAKLLVSDEVAFFLYKNPNSRASLLETAKSMLDLSKDKSLAGNDGFSTFLKNAGDISMYMNKSAYKKMFNQSPQAMLFLGGGLFNDMIDAYPVGYSISFEEDRILGKTIPDPAASKSASYFKETGLSEKDLTWLDPNGTPLMYMTANVQVKNIITEGMKNSFLKAGIEEELMPLGLTQQDLESFLAGNISIALNDIQYTPVFSEFDGTELYMKDKPLFTIHATMDNTKAYDKILAMGGTNLVNEGGLIGLELNPYNNDSVFLYVKGKELFISNVSSNLSSLRDGISWKPLQKQYLPELAQKNPMAMFVSLNTTAFEKYMKGSGNEQEKVAIRAVVSNLKQLTAHVSGDKAEVELTMTEKKQNSLWRMMLMVDDAFKAARMNAF